MIVRTALCQMPVTADVSRNLETAEQYISRAAEGGAQIVCLPEVFNGEYSNAAFRRNAEPEGGRTWLMLSAAARKHGIYLIGGSFIEEEDGRLYNTSYAFNRLGGQIGKHRKTHLFDIDVPGGIRFMESETLTAGDTLTLIDTEYGRLGVAICFDIRFSEWFRLLSEAGAQAVFVPAAFNMTTGPAHWKLSFRARALDGQMFMLGCSPARDSQGSYVAYGHSIAVDPWAEVRGELGPEAGILFQDLDLGETERIRGQIPIIRNMRRDLYRVIRR